MIATASALGTLAVLVTVAGVVLLRRRLAIVSVTGQSMEPTLTAGDRVLVRRTGLNSVRAGQIIIVEAPSPMDSDLHGGWAGAPPRRDLSRDWMIKRAAAVPGDPVPPGLPATPADDAQVPDGKLVVLGDNPDASNDSRYLGYVPGDRLLGVVIGSLPRSARKSPTQAGPARPPRAR
jgi:signal peptidase I